MQIEINNTSEDKLYRESFSFVVLSRTYGELSVELDDVSIQERETTRKKFKTKKYYWRLQTRDNTMSVEEANKLIDKYGREKITEEVKEQLIKQIKFSF